MRQMSFSVKKDRKDDMLLPLTEINQRLTADTVFARRAADPAAKRDAGKAPKLDDLIEEYCSLGIRDEQSGLGIMNPNTSRSQEVNYRSLKNFVGPKGKRLDQHDVL